MKLVDTNGRIVTTGTGMTRIYVWDGVVRLCHWTIFFSMIALSVTGLYIGHPFLTVPGEAGDHFVMGNMRAVHLYSSIAFMVAVLFRVGWAFTGTHYANWRQFIPLAADRRRDLLGTLKFYLFIHREAPPNIGHNPLASSAYTGVFALHGLMILTGLGLWSVFVTTGSWVGWFSWVPNLLGGPQVIRGVHHFTMWLLWGFFVHHLYSAVLVSMLEKNGTLESIFSGYKWFKGGK